jgi:hypothetical protein
MVVSSNDRGRYQNSEESCSALAQEKYSIALVVLVIGVLFATFKARQNKK